MYKYFRFYPLTVVVIVVVTTLCLIPIEDPPLKDVRFIDKWTHIALFGGICLSLVVETLLSGRKRVWPAPFLAALYGGVVELMQAYLTTCRSGEWLDFAADAVGAFVAFPIALYVGRKVMDVSHA